MPDIGEKDRVWRRKGRRQIPKSRETHFKLQREKMEKIHKQKVTIICHKALLLSPGLYKTFTVQLNIPLRKDEIDKRMAAAFPELEWEQS